MGSGRYTILIYGGGSLPPTGPASPVLRFRGRSKFLPESFGHQSSIALSLKQSCQRDIWGWQILFSYKAECFQASAQAGRPEGKPAERLLEQCSHKENDCSPPFSLWTQLYGCDIWSCNSHLVIMRAESRKQRIFQNLDATKPYIYPILEPFIFSLNNKFLFAEPEKKYI